MLYLKLGTALHSESCEPHEVYRTLYDNELAPMWARPLPMFHEEVAPGQKRFVEVGVVRAAAPQDFATVLSFGFDAWGNGATLEEFVAQYDRNPHHHRGQRYILEVPRGEMVASVNTLRFSRALIGLASLSVHPSHRRKGYGSLLLRAVMELLRCENQNYRFALYSEIDPHMYQRLGFQPLPEDQQFHRPAIAMVTGGRTVTAEELELLRGYF